MQRQAVAPCPAGPMYLQPNPLRRLLNAFFAANLVEEINRFVFIILGIAGAAFISGGAGGWHRVPVRSRFNAGRH